MSGKLITCSTPGCTNQMDPRSKVCRICWKKAKRDGKGSSVRRRNCLFCGVEFRSNTTEHCSTLCAAADRHAARPMGTFGDDLRQARLEARVTSTTVAEATGFTKQHVCQVERGVTGASARFKIAVMAAFPEFDL